METAFDILKLTKEILDENNYDACKIIEVIKSITVPDLAWLYYKTARMRYNQRKEEKHAQIYSGINR